MATAHTILVIAYQILKTKQPYIELGTEYLQAISQNHYEQKLVRQLKDLGYEVNKVLESA